MLEREWRVQAQQILTEEKDVGLKPDLQADPRPKYNLVVPRSSCPRCGAQITAAQNIPVVSYLLLGGKCARCGAKISVRYPLVELGTAILSSAVAWKFGFVWYTAAALLLTWMLVALSAIDIDHQPT
jgi:leader peptidase (prepilin peptidase) / N-methyltransferase